MAVDDSHYDAVRLPLDRGSFEATLDAIDLSDATVYGDVTETDTLTEQITTDWARGYSMRFKGYMDEDEALVDIEAYRPADQPDQENPVDRYTIEATVVQGSGFYDEIRQAYQLDTLL